MKRGLWDKRIPTFLGIFLIAIGIGITTFLVKQGGLFSINASTNIEPQNVRISNITDSSFTVSYTTADKTIGVLNYGDKPTLGQSGLDDRDQQSNNLTNYNLHNITVRSLSPNTKYYFAIISGKNNYMNNSSPFELITGQTIKDNPLEQNPLTGKVILPTGNSPAEGIIYLTTNGSQVISATLKSDGSFILPLNSLRDFALDSYFNINNNTVINLLAQGEELSSNILLSPTQINSVPTITLSNDYDFTTTTSPVASKSADIQSFPTFSSSEVLAKNQTPRILTPEKDQSFTDQKPVFKGTAIANDTIQITIHSDENIQTQVKADANGNWTYRPPAELSPGNHTITIIAKDASGIVKTITQSFIVYASGTQIAGANGSPTPTLKPSITLLPTISQEQTMEPTIEPTSMPKELTATPTATIAQLQSPTPSPPLPPTGNPNIVTIGIVSLLITLIGGLILLLTKLSFSTI